MGLYIDTKKAMAGITWTLTKELRWGWKWDTHIAKTSSGEEYEHCENKEKVLCQKWISGEGEEMWEEVKI